MEHLERVLGAELGSVGVEPAQLAVNPDQRAVADLQAEVRSARFDELRERFGDVEWLWAWVGLDGEGHVTAIGGTAAVV